MFTSIYNFFWDWLFNSTYPAFMSAQSAEFCTILFAVVVTLFVVWLATLPVKALLRLFFRG